MGKISWCIDRGGVSPADFRICVLIVGSRCVNLHILALLLRLQQHDHQLRWQAAPFSPSGSKCHTQNCVSESQQLVLSVTSVLSAFGLVSCLKQSSMSFDHVGPSLHYGKLFPSRLLTPSRHTAATNLQVLRLCLSTQL